MATLIQDFSPDFKDNELQNVLLQLLGGNPDTAKQGKMFLDSSQNTFKVSLDGATWSTIATTDQLNDAGVSLESVVDAFGNNVLVDGANISITYDDAANDGEGTITIAADLSSVDAVSLQGNTAADFATAAQGATADTAVQPEDIGTAAAEDTTSFATAAQGALADSATQPGDLHTVATSGSYVDLTNKPALNFDPAGTASTEADEAQAFAIQRGNHTGTQLASTISDLAATVAGLDAATIGGQDADAIQTAVTSAIVDSAPETLDTLNEIAAALNDNPNVIQDLLSAMALRNQTYAETYGDAAATSFTITHSLGTKDISVTVRDVVTGAEVTVPNRANTINTVIIEHTVAPSAGQYRVIVQGRTA